MSDFDFYKKINFIDGILWINLDRSVDRRTCMESILKNVDVPNTRIQAIDGMTEDLDAYIQNYDSRPYRSNAEIAVVLSHLKAINHLKDIPGDFFLILEDDVNFDNMKYIPYDFEQIITNCPEFDVLQIHKTSNSIPKNMYTKWCSTYWSAGSYIISRNGINNICTKYNFQDNVFQCNFSDIKLSECVIYGSGCSYTYKYNCTGSLNQDSIIHPEHLCVHKQSTYIQNTQILNDFCKDKNNSDVATI